jgi:hypothetical protein
MGKAARNRNRTRAIQTSPPVIPADNIASIVVPSSPLDCGAVQVKGIRERMEYPREALAAPPAVTEFPSAVAWSWQKDLATVTRRIENDEQAQRVQVRMAIESGATWSEVAAVLGVTKQSAHGRYRS